MFNPHLLPFGNYFLLIFALTKVFQAFPGDGEEFVRPETCPETRPTIHTLALNPEFWPYLCVNVHEQGKRRPINAGTAVSTRRGRLPK